jgi:hypothetical protein
LKLEVIENYSREKIIQAVVQKYAAISIKMKKKTNPILFNLFHVLIGALVSMYLDFKKYLIWYFYFWDIHIIKKQNRNNEALIAALML